MTDLTHTKLCEICDCFSLCHRVIKDNPNCSIMCREMRKMVEEIIEKNIDNEDEEWYN